MDGAAQDEGASTGLTGELGATGGHSSSGTSGTWTGSSGGTAGGSESGTGAEDETRPGWPLDPNEGRSTVKGISLVDNEVWQPLGPEFDPESPDRPSDVTCPRGAWTVEAGGLEVDTGKCNYFSMYQGLTQPIAAGQVVRALLWHARLVAQQPSHGHVVLRIGGQLVFEKIVDIPSPGNAYDMFFIAPQDFPAGTLVDLHLHNHGYNTWNLLYLTARSPG